MFALVALSSQIPLALAQSPLPTAGSQVAVFGTEPITFAQLPAAGAELARSQGQYQQRLKQLALEQHRAQQAILERAVNDFVDERVMAQEAQARHVSVTELARDIGSPEITDADVAAFYERNRSYVRKPLEELRPAIAQLLRQEAAADARRHYLTALRTKYSARSLVEPVRDAVMADGPDRGPADARVTIVEFADFQCPFCRRMAPVLGQLLEKYPQDLRLVYRQLPLTELHPNALRAAEASLCAREQGKFWEMHDALFADQDALDLDSLKKTATRLRLESQPFAACLDSGRPLPSIRADAQAASDLGVDGTPGLFVNGRFVSGAVSYEEMAALIDDELQRQAQRTGGAHVASREP